jgi:uncharacterized protein YrzB (UPF0473 family)
VLEENDVVQSSDYDYGAVYLPTGRAKQHWDTVEEVFAEMREVDA